MSDSIDRVFVKAISTIRALSTRTGYGSLPRPPVESRIKLYGLYKQATEGNVEGIMSRPQGNRPEDESAKRKWDAWKQEEGLSKTEAKRRYIAFLIETMKIYASGTHEARELLSELNYIWEQIKDINYSPSPPMTPLVTRYLSQNNNSDYAGSTLNDGFNDSFNSFQGEIGYGEGRYLSVGSNNSHRNDNLINSYHSSNNNNNSKGVLRNELHDVQVLKNEVQVALKRIHEELNVTNGKSNKKQYSWVFLLKISNWLLKAFGSITKKIFIDLFIILLIIKFLKFKKGIEIDSNYQTGGKILDKLIFIAFKVLNKANLINFTKIYINVE